MLYYTGNETGSRSYPHFAPQEGDILGRSFIAILRKDPLTSNLDYLSQHLFPKFGVLTRDIGEVVFATIIDPYFDDRLALDKVQTEADRWCTEVSVYEWVLFIDPKD